MSGIHELKALADPPAWLAAIADGAVVGAALRRVVPGVTTCDVDRVRIRQDGTYALFRLTLAPQRRDLERTVELGAEILPFLPPGEPALEGDLGEPGWRCTLPDLRLRLSTAPADGGLASLPELLDADQARQLIDGALQSCPGLAGFRTLACRPRIARYKPGSRCTVVYDLVLPDDAPARWPRSVVGKTYLGDKGRVAFDAMRALWCSPLQSSESVAIAEPLALVRGGRVLLQCAISHDETLKEAIRRCWCSGADAERLKSLLQKTGRGLAELHASRIEPAVETTWQDEVDDVRRVVRRLATLVPELDGAAATLLEDLDRAARDHPAREALPSHGSFRPAQVVVAGDDIGFIDFDSFCSAEPALDVALFCSSLRDTGLRAALAGGAGGPSSEAASLAVLDTLCERFVEGYEASAALDRRRVRLWETLHALTAVLHCWTKVKFDRLPHRMAILHHHLDVPAAR